MPGAILTTSSKIQCPHGGQALLETSNAKSSAGELMLLEDDVHMVDGCPFTEGTKYSPCLTIEWEAGANKVTVDGTAVLVESSIGTCKSGEGAVQGIALVTSTQQKVTAQ